MSAGVHQQRGVLAQCLDLRFKGVTLGIMHQREAMRGGANGLQTIQLGGQQIGVLLNRPLRGSSSGGHGGPLVSAASADIHARTILLLPTPYVRRRYATAES